MIDYSKWKETKISVASLLIDPQNPRFPKKGSSLSQNYLINEMIRKYKIYELAKSIAQEGYFPDKSLIITKEDDNYYVLEGNRRLSAIKSLLTTEIIDDVKIRKKFEILNSQIEKKYIQQIKVVIAPNREAANPIIFKEHTPERTTMPWSPIMQAEFYKQQIDKGMSIDDLVDEFVLSKGEISKFLKMYYMYDLACKMEYPDEDSLNKVLDKQNFPAYVLQRIYDSTIMKDRLKLDFDENGKPKGTANKKDFSKAYTLIVENVVNKKVDTRKLNNEKGFKEYIKKIEDDLPKTKGRFHYDDFDEPRNEQPLEEKPKAEQKKTSTTRVPTGIFSYGTTFSLKGASNLQVIYGELRKMPVRTYPNLCAISLRVLLDKTLRMYLKKKRVYRIQINENGTKKTLELADVQLGQILEYIARNDTNVIDDKNVRKVISKFKSSNSGPSLSTLNSVVHNEEFSIKEQDIRTIWLCLEGLFKIIFTEPE